MVKEEVCPFCKKLTWSACGREYVQTGYGKFAIKQYFHSKCYDKYIREQKNMKPDTQVQMIFL